ncbi:prolyl 3-hydroxylase 1-like [Tribolium madens]|uniref:prolyl 3-hydroxylase 1-like n=1 Tax=Tribolium madens TaxID=41895 RepID=UPI001CF74D42|nr:prolyl 3-hydroxylase 1-like [Tribolium madens]
MDKNTQPAHAERLQLELLLKTQFDLAMVSYARVVYAVLLSCITHVHTDGENITESCMYLYEKGVEAYLDNRFNACIVHFENAIQKYRDYRKKLQNCRIMCKEEADLSEPLYPTDIDDLLFFEKAVKNTLCIMRCKKVYKDNFFKFNVNKETEKLFEDLKPYEYLHICYFQNKEVQKAASAAFTYLVSYPDDKIMSANLKYYSSMSGVDMTEIVNFEAKDYVYLYIHGVDAYERKDWVGVVDNMEESLVAYLQADEECRAQCEGPFDQGWYPDFIPSIANHFTYCLKCKQKCKTKLSSLNGEKHDDLLPSHYHYLQYAYFKRGDLKAACAAVASYLLFYPNDETMLENKKFYSKLPKASDDFFIPRPEALHYVQRHTYEQRILKFIVHEYKFDVSTEITSEALKYRVVMTEKQLRGPNRFVSEGLATGKECQTLVNTAKMFALSGDGYQGYASPFTTFEKFRGITLSRATALVYFGLLEPQYLQLLLTISELGKTKIEEFFKIKKPLYFTYTHLVCRSAKQHAPNNRTDYSHTIHADNCNLISDKVCEKLPPSYTHRDYSAIIYLNDDFEGGEFVFSADAKGEKIQSVINPRCGKMVAFSSGSENLHGVRAVKKGSRCAIAIWFTFDPKHAETDRDEAWNVISKKSAN